jgi:16S rRNA (cytosine967-C5)-methyltransferase
MPVSPARAAAFEILLRIETTDSYASELLHSTRFAKLSTADHGLLTELVMGVLRWRGVLDDKIAEHTSQPLTKLDREVLIALRLGAYQLLFLDRVPKHAAINESVELVKRARKKSAAGMVNAVLRKISNSHFSQKRGEMGHRSFDDCSAHPAWLVERWQRVYGPEATNKICEYDQSTPQTAVRMTSPEAPSTSHVGAGALTRPAAPCAAIEDIQLDPGRLLAHAAIATAGDISQTAAFRERRLVIQDEASQLVALLVGRGNSILDCCAAPGGKTRIMAEKNSNATVVAMDLHPHRANLLRRLAPESNIQVIAADARHMPFATNFDRVLVDAPCSGTGTLARNPEIKWRLTPEDILRLQAYQIEILTAAMKHVAKGGRVIYSTCSLEPEENEAVIEKALASESLFKLVDCGDELRRLAADGELVWGDVESLLHEPYLRTIPGVHPCDGFFAAVLEKA